MRTGTANNVGLASWTIRPAADTRMYGTAAGGARRSLSTVLQVRQPVRRAAPVSRPAPRRASRSGRPGLLCLPALPTVTAATSGPRAEAQAFYNRYFPFYGDFARLDGSDNDGRACESLP